MSTSLSARPPLCCLHWTPSLEASEEYCQWWDGSGGGGGSLAEFAAALQQRPFLWLLPGEQVLTLAVALPGRRRQWPKLLPFALEDELVDDIGDLHFALAKVPSTNDKAAVAVVNRALLARGAARLQALQLRPRAVAPDYLLLPWQPGRWSLALAGERALVRLDAARGFAVEASDALALLELARAELEQPPAALWFYTPAEVMVDAPQMRQLASLTDALEPHRYPRPPSGQGGVGVPWPCLEVAPPTIDLDQGLFAPSHSWRRLVRPWQGVAALLLVWLGLQGVATGLDYYRLAQQRRQLDHAIEALFRRTMPATARLVNPQVQLAAELQRRRGQAQGEGDFLALLYRAGAAVPGSGAELTALRYRDGQLELALQGGDLGALETLRQQLDQSDLAVDLRTRRRDSQIEAELVVRRGQL